MNLIETVHRAGDIEKLSYFKCKIELNSGIYEIRELEDGRAWALPDDWYDAHYDEIIKVYELV